MLYPVLILILAIALAVTLWPARKQRQFCLAVTAAALLGTFGIYYKVGAPDIVPMLAKREARLAELKTSITANEQKVKADPKNLQGWIELGSDFMETGQYGASANAFKQAVLISRGNPILILAYAKAMIAEDDGKVSDKAKTSLEMVLLQDGENAEAKYFLTLRKLQDGKNAEAMKDMKALYRSLPDDSPLKAQIDRMIGR